MILSLPEVVSADEHAALLQLIDRAAFVDGRQTTSALLADKKRNRQLPADHPVMPDIARIVMGALRRHQVFMESIQPRSLAGLLVSRYEAGMEYAAHVDNPLMGDHTVMRSDVSFTLFLSAPESYEGGELAFVAGSGESAHKNPARGMICYDTGQLHRVRPVVSGVRLVVVGWLQSLVRDAAVRELMHDLAQARSLVHASEGNSRAFELLNKSYANLLRRYAET